MTLTNLRQNLFQVVDKVLETGIPIAIERGGKTLLLTPQDEGPKLARLKRRKLIKGDAESIVDAKAGEWRESKNLK